MNDNDSLALLINGPQAQSLLVVPAVAGESGGAHSADAASRVKATRGGASTRLPDGRILYCGGVAVGGDEGAPLCFTPPMLLAPQWTTEHAFDDDANDFRASGPFEWSSCVVGNDASDTSTAHAGSLAALVPPTHPPWYHVLEHTATALSDLRVFIFGGRSDPHRAASCHNHVRMADLYGDTLVGDPHARFASVLPQRKASTSAVVGTDKHVLGSNRRDNSGTASPMLRATASRTSPSRSQDSSATADALHLVYRGEAPTRRFGHSATLVGSGRLVMVAGGVDERDNVLSDMHYFLPFPAATPPSAMDSGSVDAGVWLKHGADSPRALRTLPQPAHHHRLLLLPPSGGPSSSPDGTTTESWLLVADGKYLYRLTVAVRLPPSSPDGADGAVVVPQVQACFDVMGGWAPVVGGGIANVVPCRVASAVVPLSDAIIAVHGGYRSLPSAPAARRAEALRFAGRKGRLHRAVSAVGDLTDAAFLFDLRTLRWRFDAALTDALGYAAGHDVLPLSDGRPTSQATGSASPARHDGFRTHHIVVGATTACGEGDSFTTISTREPPPSLPPYVLQAMVGRACSGVVQRTGCLMLGHLDMGFHGDTFGAELFDASATPTSKVLWQPPLPKARRVSCTALSHHGADHEQGTTDLISEASTAWASPAVVIRDTLLQQEVVDAASALKVHLRDCFTSILRGSSDAALVAAYFRQWLAFVSLRRDDVDVQLAAQSHHVGELRKCCECNAAPCEVWLLPCHHFVLCGVCASGAIDCPACGTEVQGTEVACNGRQFPFLHGFLANISDGVRVEPSPSHLHDGAPPLRLSAQQHDSSEAYRQTPPAFRTEAGGVDATQFSSLVRLAHRRRGSNSTASPGAGAMTPSVGELDYHLLLGANRCGAEDEENNVGCTELRFQPSDAQQQRMQQRRANNRRTFDVTAAIKGRRSLRVASPMMF